MIYTVRIMEVDGKVVHRERITADDAKTAAMMCLSNYFTGEGALAVVVLGANVFYIPGLNWGVTATLEDHYWN